MVGRGLPTEADEHPKIYRMKLWATNEVRAKSKFWSVNCIFSVYSWFLLFSFGGGGISVFLFLMFVFIIRYFLRKLKKVKKSNGQVLAINEVLTIACSLHYLEVNWLPLSAIYWMQSCHCWTKVGLCFIIEFSLAESIPTSEWCFHFHMDGVRLSELLEFICLLYLVWHIG